MKCVRSNLLKHGVFTITIFGLLLLFVFLGSNGTALAAPGEALILDTTVTGGVSSREAQALVNEGLTPVLVTAAAWATMSQEDFASYDAIVFGDKTCSTDPITCMGPATANYDVWGPVIDGNIIIIGSDPVYHAGSKPGAITLINQGIAFAVNELSKTGAYIDLSCYYHFSPSGTIVPFLEGISGGGFSVIGASFLPGLNDVHIVATHPSLGGLTDADLSNWGNSVHEGFTEWPIDFEVLAIARDSAGSYTAPDGTVGYPYIIARGVTVISDITLSPETATNPVGTSHTVIATVTTDDPAEGTPMVGVEVDFEIIAGPHTGETGFSSTNEEGIAEFSYTGYVEGIDTIQATFMDSQGIIQRSNRVTKEWIDICTVCGDLDGDCDVDADDRNILRGAFRSCTGDPGYIEEADYDENGCINYTDYQLWYQCYKGYIAP